MTAAEIIDLYLTPLCAGLGAILGLSWMAKRKPENYGQFSSWKMRLAIGALVSVLLYLSKVLF